MILFQVIAYTLAIAAGVYFIFTGIKKIDEIKNGGKTGDISEKSETLGDFYTDEQAHMAAINSDDMNFEKGYFAALENGEKAQQFLIVGGTRDCALIRSLLLSEGIPSYTENEHLNSFFSVGVNAQAGFSIKLFILVKDYEKAYEIVMDYINRLSPVSPSETKKEDLGEKIKTTTAEVVSGMFFVPLPQNAEEKTLGITILPKYVEE